MALVIGKRLSLRVAAITAAVLAVAAVAAPEEPARAQYWGYQPPPVYQPPPGYYYPQPPQYPPWYYYSPYRNPYGYTLNNPDYPCVWEGRGCPTGR